MQTEDIISDSSTPAHERVYRALRGQIMGGEIAPGAPLTLRKLATDHGVSMTPAREAVRRLASEGALQFSSTGRITTPLLGNDRLEELASLRALLEPELASRALPRAHPALIERLRAINVVIDQMVAKHDDVGYVRSNQDFHRTLYLRAQAPATLMLVESIWLQASPTMRTLYAKLHRPEATDNHRKIIAALHAGDEPGLRLAIRADVTNGMRLLLT